MKAAPLTVPEARAILVADDALDYSWPHREATGQILSDEEAVAWNKLVESAKERVASWPLAATAVSKEPA